MWCGQFIDWLKSETCPSSLHNSEMANWQRETSPRFYSWCFQNIEVDESTKSLGKMWQLFLVVRNVDCFNYQSNMETMLKIRRSGAMFAFLLCNILKRTDRFPLWNEPHALWIAVYGPSFSLLPLMVSGYGYSLWNHPIAKWCSCEQYTSHWGTCTKAKFLAWVPRA